MLCLLVIALSLTFCNVLIEIYGTFQNQQLIIYFVKLLNFGLVQTAITLEADVATSSFGVDMKHDGRMRHYYKLQG